MSPRIVVGRHLEVTLTNGTVQRYSFSRWSTEDRELAIWDEDGELIAVFADGAWVSGTVIDHREEDDDA